MSTADGPHRPTADRTAIRAVAVTFAVNGIAFPSLLPRFPQIAAAVGASEAAFGLALAGTGVGGLVGGAMAPVLARRLGLVRTTTACGLALCAAVVLVAVAPSVPLLAVAMAVAGLADAAHDISMNEVALGEQARRDRSVMGRLHGVWSVGATVGTAVGAGAAALGVPVGIHLAVVAVVGGGVQVAASGRMRDRTGSDATPTTDRPAHPAIAPAGGRGTTPTTAPTTDPTTAPATSPTPAAGGVGRRWPVLAGLVVATFAAMLAEAVPLDWSALALRRALDAPAGVAGLGPVVFSLGVLGGRAVADPLIDRLGPARLLVWANGGAGVAMATGLVVGAATGSPWPLLVGLAVGGVGAAANFPLLFGAGDGIAERLHLPAGTGSSVVGTLPRLGALVLPAGVGVLAGALGLLPALGAVVLGSAVVAVVLPRLVRT